MNNSFGTSILRRTKNKFLAHSAESCEHCSSSVVERTRPSWGHKQSNRKQFATTASHCTLSNATISCLVANRSDCSVNFGQAVEQQLSGARTSSVHHLYHQPNVVQPLRFGVKYRVHHRVLDMHQPNVLLENTKRFLKATSTKGLPVLSPYPCLA